METTPKTLHISLFWNPGVFIDTREEGGQGTASGPKRGRGRCRTAAEMRLGPRFRGLTGAARVVHLPSVPCQVMCPVSSFAFLVLTNQLL